MPVLPNRAVSSHAEPLAFGVESPPLIDYRSLPDGSLHAVLSGSWRIALLQNRQQFQQLSAALENYPSADLHVFAADSPPALQIHWDLSAVQGLDTMGAQLLWRCWGKQLPPNISLLDEQGETFERLASLSIKPYPRAKPLPWEWLVNIGQSVGLVYEHTLGLLRLTGQSVLDLLYCMRHPSRIPWKEISAQVFHTGTEALMITALVGFLIGVVLSFLSSQQLRLFGADIYIVQILGLSIIRELGPVLAAILVAGRSGSAMTAQIGVMRLTQELDALKVMGIARGLRLVFPRVLALAITMPLLVIWTSAMALAGGMVAAQSELGLSPGYFLLALPNVVSIANYWIGLGKGVAFGILIAVLACHFGLRIKPNTQSLGNGTTTSVVTAITAVILADAIFAIVFKGIGLVA